MDRAVQDLPLAPGDTVAGSSWAERNRRWLAARFAFWCEHIERHAAADALLPSVPPPADADFIPAALHVATLFGLTAFERELLIVTAGVELDDALRSAIAHAQGLAAGERVRLDYSLALAVLPEPHWDALSPLGALRHWSLISFDIGVSTSQARLRIDERVLHELTGVADFDDTLLGVASFSPAAAISPEHEAVAQRLGQALAPQRRDDAMVAVLPANAAQRASACALATAAWAAHHLRCLLVDAAALPVDARDLAHVVRRLQREAALSCAGLVLVLQGDAGLSESALRLLIQLRGAVVVVGTPQSTQLAQLAPRRWLRFAWPDAAPALAAELPTELRAAVQRAGQQFQVEPATMALAIAAAAVSAEPQQFDQVLWDTLREASRDGLDTLSQRISSRARFADLVLPPHALSQLQEIAGQLRLRHRVYEDWGFAAQGSRGLGIAALFAGDSGTGKTLAAEVIANEARLDLYRVDLASTVSKYIGETEKNLARLFDAAQASGAVLLFDEADALFGKRSEVKDSHDRYANIEVAYLLQRIDNYRGLAILTTNMKSALDPAFLRRIRFIVQFPFPDESARTRLWQRQFPPQAPLGSVDFAALARLQIAGGTIRSVALNAAFAAADKGRAIDDDVLWASARAELAKLERPLAGDSAAVRR